MNETYILLVKYINTATDLADNVRRNIQAGTGIDNATVLALNEFIKTAHAIKHLTDEIKKDTVSIN